MANAEVKTAPEKKVVTVKVGETTEEVVKDSNEHLVLLQEFDTSKKYMFELAMKNPEPELPVIEVQGQKARVSPHKEFPPYRNIIMSSQIVWKGQRRNIRYYDGCDTIFVDKQPKDRETIEQLIAQSRKRAFLEGKFGCFGEDKMLLLYMNITSWNTESPFRTRTADGVFKSVNPDKRATAEANKLDETEKALELAKNASNTKMMIHAAYLGIQTMDWDSGNELTEKEIRTAYRKEALRNSAEFITSYGNKSLETQYYINKALDKGVITNKFNPNKATWGSSNKEICDISGLRTPEAIAQRLFEFSTSEDGEEFLIQLKAVSDN